MTPHPFLHKSTLPSRLQLWVYSPVLPTDFVRVLYWVIPFTIPGTWHLAHTKCSMNMSTFHIFKGTYSLGRQTRPASTKQKRDTEPERQYRVRKISGAQDGQANQLAVGLNQTLRVVLESFQIKPFRKLPCMLSSS